MNKKMLCINKKLQEWAEEKKKILEKWTEEYDSICKEENIDYNPMVNFCLDRNYVASIYAFDENSENYIFYTYSKFISR